MLTHGGSVSTRSRDREGAGGRYFPERQPAA
jgi:hypothetical protein